MNIIDISACEILDSRGNPTISATVMLDDGSSHSASVPSGASTGEHEAHELRDNDPARYGGKGVLQAVQHIHEDIRLQLIGCDPSLQQVIDQMMIDLDGSDNKSRLGANAILAVSMATARAGAHAKALPLYQHLANLAETHCSLPRACFNVINGGMHAGNSLGFQEFMISPNYSSMREQVRAASELYQSLKDYLHRHYGGSATLLGDEGGFAPPINSAREALEVLEQVVNQSPHQGQVEYALDVAASEFYTDGHYDPNFKQTESCAMPFSDLLSQYSELVESFPIFSIEDPADQNAFDDFAAFRSAISQSRPVRTVGDDLTVTNTARINQAIEQQSCDTLLLKINQIGSISEAIDAFRLAKQHDWQVMISHRSGETTDDFIADLAVGLGAEYIKSGAPARGERVTKYNRLLTIEQELHG